jgi:putative two-component system response regulator
MEGGPQAGVNILVAACDIGNGRRLVRMLEDAGYEQPALATSPREALSYMESRPPSLLVIEPDGPCQDLCPFLREISEFLGVRGFFPILVLYEDLELETCREAVALGADEFARKDLGPGELLVHINSLLGAHLRSSGIRQELEEGLIARAKELERAKLEIVGCLGKIAELRDGMTGAHIARVGRLSGRIAHALHLPQEQVALIMHAAPLHDIGKAVLSDQTLLHAGNLSDDEREMMQKHTYLGAEILQGGTSEFITTAREIAACHHERWDGNGYPCGLKGTEIPLSARIVSVADAFDAMTNERPHRGATSIEGALDTIKEERGWQFDPQVVDALFRVLGRKGTTEAVPCGRSTPLMGAR